ncbi:MAG: hypothetical protein RL071_4773 [Pseudomonadota bacterium]
MRAPLRWSALPLLRCGPWLAAALVGCPQGPLKIAQDSAGSGEVDAGDGAPGPADAGADAQGDGGGGDADSGAGGLGPTGDADGDGLTNAQEGSPTGSAGDGRDSDEDGVFDHLDDDSDGDGILDSEEGPDGAGGLRDTDNDDTPDVLDLDSDNDGAADRDEGRDPASGGLRDTDGDGQPDFRDGDSDGDSMLDREESTDGGAYLPDTDGDGTPDIRDLDSDADSLPDQRDGAGDNDGDGVANWRDPRNDGSLDPVTFVAISTPFTQPVGIDFHEASGTVVMSVNYPSGAPYAFETVDADGDHAAFSGMSGLSDEVKIATVRSGNTGGFATGELFVGNGVDGQIVRISADGSVATNPWVDLPGTNNGLMRGSLYVDPTGVWGGDLLVATTQGELWRVNSAGVPTLVADVGSTHLEGLLTVPDAPVRYGPFAGKALAGAEGEGRLYAISPDGTVEHYVLGVNVEDIDMAWPGENFFGVNFGTSRILGVDGAQLAGMAGDILLTQESHSGAGLYRLWWDGSTPRVEELTATSGGPTLGQWEHVTFARAGIKEVPVLPPPSWRF